MSVPPLTTTSAAGRLISILRVRNFSLLWGATIFNGLAEHMEALILAWLVLQTTDSPFYLGLWSASRFVGRPMGIVFGSMADRLPRRNLLQAIQLATVGLAVAMLFILSMPSLVIWPILAITFVKGIFSATNYSVRLPLMADIVSPEQLPNAVPLSTIGLHATAMVGPALAGLFLESLGPRNSYVVVLALALLSVLGIFFMRPQPQPQAARGESPLRSVVTGFSYVRRNDLLLGIILLILLFNLTGFTLPFALMPVFARDVLGSDARGLGLLMMIMGVGAMLGSVVMASLSRMRNMSGSFLLWTNVIWHGIIILVALASLVAPSLWVAAGLLLFVGVCQNAMIVGPDLILLREASVEIRGRVMGLRSAAIFPVTIGSLIVGAVASAFGAPAAMITIGVTGVVLTGPIAIGMPGLRKRPPAKPIERPLGTEDTSKPGRNH